MIRLSILFTAWCISLMAHGQTDLSTKLKKPLPEIPTIELAEAGFNPDSINNLIQMIDSVPPEDFRGMVVIKDGKLVIEEYFNTYWRETIHDIRSAGKSITALLLGIAIDEGLVQGLEQSVIDFFPKEKYPTASEDYQKIKVKHLLDMSSGLDADTGDPNSPGHSVQWIANDQWIDYLLNIPLVSTPGEKWVYADINALLIGKIIEQASGKTLADFAKEKLFTPLNIREFYWYKNASGTTGAMGNLYLPTLDFAKIGLLVLNKGKWNGKEIVSEGWIGEISKRRVDISSNNPFADYYGLMWYKSERMINDVKYEYLFASGNGGNLLAVFPSQNMVICLTSSAYGQGYGHGRSNNIMKFILSSMKNE